MLPTMAKVAFVTSLLVSFTGGLAAGLGHGFDLGTEWPGSPGDLVAAALRGSLEPVHRFLTVAAGVLYALVFALVYKKNRANVHIAAAALIFLTLTALTGIIVLLTLGGEVPKPLSYTIYPINNGLALATTLTMALLAAKLSPNVGGSDKRAILYRGAAFWGAVASISGAYILGYHKIELTPIQYSLIPTPSLDQAVWIIHLLSAALAVALATIALASAKRLTAWHILLATALLIQPATGILMYFGASVDPWAPGPQSGFHAAFAHLFVVSAFVIYMKNKWTSFT